MQTVTRTLKVTILQKLMFDICGLIGPKSLAKHFVPANIDQLAGCGWPANLQDGDDLSTADNSLAPNVSVVQRFHCIKHDEYSLYFDFISVPFGYDDKCCFLLDDDKYHLHLFIIGFFLESQWSAT
jgi:hypothetical protein